MGRIVALGCASSRFDPGMPRVASQTSSMRSYMQSGIALRDVLDGSLYDRLQSRSAIHEMAAARVAHVIDVLLIDGHDGVLGDVSQVRILALLL